MNITQANDIANLRHREPEVKPKTATAQEVAEFVFAAADEKNNPFLYLMPEEWKQKWLPSKKFVLMNMPIACAALPTQPRDEEWVLTRIHAKATHPVVVDMNKNGVGKASVGFVPPVIVLDGKHRFKAAALRGDSHILAWVGEDAVKEIQAQLDSKRVVSKRKVDPIAASTAFEHKAKLSTK